MYPEFRITFNRLVELLPLPLPLCAPVRIKSPIDALISWNAASLPSGSAESAELGAIPLGFRNHSRFLGASTLGATGSEFSGGPGPLDDPCRFPLPEPPRRPKGK